MKGKRHRGGGGVEERLKSECFGMTKSDQVLMLQRRFMDTPMVKGKFIRTAVCMFVCERERFALLVSGTAFEGERVEEWVGRDKATYTL